MQGRGGPTLAAVGETGESTGPYEQGLGPVATTEHFTRFWVYNNIRLVKRIDAGHPTGPISLCSTQMAQKDDCVVDR